jgi:hypothetical protein
MASQGGGFCTLILVFSSPSGFFNISPLMLFVPISCSTKFILFYDAFKTITLLSLKSNLCLGDKEACNMGLGESAHVATLLALSFESVSP